MQKWHAILAALVITTLGATPAWAQNVFNPVGSPAIAEWIQILFVIVASAIMLGVSILSSRRGHRD